MKEEKAIERIHDLIHTCDVGIAKHGEYDDLFLLDKQALETVLNLIETQKAEIDAKEFDIEALKEERENDINKIDKLQVELEKRDREINRLKDELGYTRKVVEGEKKDNA